MFEGGGLHRHQVGQAATLTPGQVGQAATTASQPASRDAGTPAEGREGSRTDVLGDGVSSGQATGGYVADVRKTRGRGGSHIFLKFKGLRYVKCVRKKPCSMIRKDAVSCVHDNHV